MHIFIDESGNFVIPEEKKPKVSCVTSLTIPDKHMDAVVGESLLKSSGVIKKR